MKEAFANLISLFKDNGLEGIDIINEMLRFRVLDQLISSQPGTREWGITSEKLLALAQQSTVESFGPISYGEEVFRKLYGPSFGVDLMDFIGETDIVSGLEPGHQWRIALQECIDQYAKEEGVTFFGFVEEYTSLVDDILQAFGKDKVVLHTNSPTCYSVLSRLYPMAKIVDYWPEDVKFDHVVAAAAGVFDSSEDIVEQMAGGIDLVKNYGTARLFLPMAMVYSQLGINKMALQFLLQQDRMEAIREWAPLGALEFVYGVAPVKKTRIAVREVMSDAETHQTTYKETPFIQLPHGVFADMPVFSVANYALSLSSVLMPGNQNCPALGLDCIYCQDGRLPQRALDMIAISGTFFLSFKRVPVQVQRFNQDGEGIQSGQAMYRVDVSLSQERPEDTVYWMTYDKEIAYMWYAYFHTELGQDILARLASLVTTDVAFGQLIGSCRRALLKPEQEELLALTMEQAMQAYQEALQKAEEGWHDTLVNLGQPVMPEAEECI